MTGDEVATLRMPGSGWWLQWRRDEFWRELPDQQHRDEVTGVHVPGPDDWARWSGHRVPQVRGGEWGGVASWWLVYGELPGPEPATVELADGTRPEVHVLGRLWACEWFTVAQPATVRVAGERFDLPFAEPHRRREHR